MKMTVFWSVAPRSMTNFCQTGDSHLCTATVKTSNLMHPVIAYV